MYEKLTKCPNRTLHEICRKNTFSRFLVGEQNNQPRLLRLWVGRELTTTRWWRYQLVSSCDEHTWVWPADQLRCSTHSTSSLRPTCSRRRSRSPAAGAAVRRPSTPHRPRRPRTGTVSLRGRSRAPGRAPRLPRRLFEHRTPRSNLTRSGCYRFATTVASKQKPQQRHYIENLYHRSYINTMTHVVLMFVTCSWKAHLHLHHVNLIVLMRMMMMMMMMIRVTELRTEWLNQYSVAYCRYSIGTTDSPAWNMWSKYSSGLPSATNVVLVRAVVIIKF